MDNDLLKIPKRRLVTSMWVETEGQVIASFFLAEPDEAGSDAETPQDVLNAEAPFVVVMHEDPQEPRFYNKSAIIRVDYQEPARAPAAECVILPARLGLRDGSVVEGEVRELLPPDHQRLSDYLNHGGSRFIRLYEPGTEDQVMIVNRDHIIRILPTGGS